MTRGSIAYGLARSLSRRPSERRHWRSQLTGPRNSLAISLSALLLCIVAFAFSPHERLFHPLTAVLAACALVANVAHIRMSERHMIDASFAPTTVAIGLLGPAPAFAVVVVGELGSWCFRRCRYRPTVLPINLVAVGGTALLLAGVFAYVRPDSLLFYPALAAVGLTASPLNAVVLSVLLGLHDDESIVAGLADHLRLLPAVAVSVLLGITTVSFYRSAGLAAMTVVLLAIIVFNYVVNLALSAQQRAERIAQWAADRQRLVVQALDAEDRERRALAEQLHDQAIQDLLVARQDLAVLDQATSGPIIQAIDSALQQLRGAVFNLHPSVLEQAGLTAAIDAVARQQGKVGGVQITIDIEPRATGIQDRLLFTAARELLLNVTKHAEASHARVRVCIQANTLLLEVLDDGRGIPYGARNRALRSGHIGLASLGERAEAVGGRLDIRNPPAGGAHVRLELPLPKECSPKG